MAGPEFWLIAGPNGAGKTTAMASPPIRELSEGVRFLNPDERTLQMLREEGWSGFAAVPVERLPQIFVTAANAVFAELTQAVERGEAIGSETVLSTHKYRPLVERTIALGGTFVLLYVGLRSPDISAQRVARRVAEGGHDVPADRLAARWARSMENLGWYARQAERFFVFDNSDAHIGIDPLLIARGGVGKVEILEPDTIPAITASLTAAFSE